MSLPHVCDLGHLHMEPVCEHYLDLITPKMPEIAWAKFPRLPLNCGQRANIYLDEFTTAKPGAELSFTKEDLEALAAMMERQPKIQWSKMAVDAEGKPAAYEFQGTVFIHPDYASPHNGHPITDFAR